MCFKCPLGIGPKNALSLRASARPPRSSCVRQCRGSVFTRGPMGATFSEAGLSVRPYMQIHCCLSLIHRGDHTWTTMLGQSVRLRPVPIQSLSELERARLQEVALYHLEERNLHFTIRIPQVTRKRRKSLRRKFDSFSKEKKERETAPKAFGIPLSQAIANDRQHKQRQDALRESRRDCLDLEASVLHFRAEKQQQHEGRKLCGPHSALELGSMPLSHTRLDSAPRVHRRGGLSVDCLSDLVESQSRLLEALQLSHPNELDIRKAAGRTQAKLSLNPIYRQVPRVVERCCHHIQIYGLNTVGIFRVGSSKKRVRQLRDDFDMGVDVILDDEHSVHDVAALLKEFLRDIPDPLLPCELYSAFLYTTTLQEPEQLPYLQLLLYLLPPCNCDTLLQLLGLLHVVQEHAEDKRGPPGQEVPGNKMTAANLAVIFGPNLLQREQGSGHDSSQQALGIEDSAAVISITLKLIKNHKRLFTVSAEFQQEVLMSLIQTDPDVIDYLLRRKLSSQLTTDTDVESDSREQEPESSLESAGPSGDGLFPLETSPLFPELQGDGSLSSEVFFNMLCLGPSRKQSSEDSAMKTIGQMRQFHSHHDLLSLGEAPDPVTEEACWEGSSRAGCKQDNSRDSVWVRQDAATQRAITQPLNFWDYFTGKATGSETIV